MSMSDRFDIFTMTITQIYRSLQRIKNREMTEVNLKGVHVMCLHTLNHNPGGMTLTALSQACESATSSQGPGASKQINNMEYWWDYVAN